MQAKGKYDPPGCCTHLVLGRICSSISFLSFLHTEYACLFWATTKTVTTDFDTCVSSSCESHLFSANHFIRFRMRGQFSELQMLLCNKWSLRLLYLYKCVLLGLTWLFLWTWHAAGYASDLWSEFDTNCITKQFTVQAHMFKSMVMFLRIWLFLSLTSCPPLVTSANNSPAEKANGRKQIAS